jgi:methionine sulfoxide reductase heme-binding subunit
MRVSRLANSFRDKGVRRFLTSKWAKVIVFVLGLGPAIALVVGGFTGGLGPEPVTFIEHKTGDTVLKFLALTLTITPLRKLLRLPELIRLRRMLGLFAFFYVCAHFLTYLILDQRLSLAGMWDDVWKRKYITVGFTGFMLLIPLAITSTAGWIRRLGGRKWQALHRMIYLAAVCGVIHYYWLVKSDVRWPLFYGAVFAVLLFWRLVDWMVKKGKHAPAMTAATE